MAELEPVAARLFDRHLDAAQTWYPHEFVPWSRGEDFEEGWEFDPAAAPMPEPVRNSLFLNLLTEDNLPHYFHTIASMYGGDGVWSEWANRWTAEEGRHSIVIREYLTVTRQVDPVALEDARMRQVVTGQVPRPECPIEGIVYVALQELATRVAHRNTGVQLRDATGDRVGFEILARVAKDENLHHLFYRDLVAAALEIDASATVIAMEAQVRDFEMPGAGVEGFAELSLQIAQAGIYDLALHHDQILVPVVMRHWGVESIEGLDDEAERSRTRLIRRIRTVERAARRMSEQLAEASTPAG